MQQFFFVFFLKTRSVFFHLFSKTRELYTNFPWIIDQLNNSGSLSLAICLKGLFFWSVGRFDRYVQMNTKQCRRKSDTKSLGAGKSIISILVFVSIKSAWAFVQYKLHMLEHPLFFVEISTQSVLSNTMKIVAQIYSNSRQT